MLRTGIPLLALAVLLARPIPAGAHRLDEYLQATRVAVGVDRVVIEIDLTPGVSIAPQVSGWIDTNRDGQIGSTEANAYAKQVLDSLAVSLDAAAIGLALEQFQMPDPSEMRQGTGIVRLRASGALPRARTGRHQLTFVNSHHPETSVYLANALVPADRRITIVAQHHDRDQHGLTIDYELNAWTRWTRTMWLVVGALGLVILGAARRPRRVT
jgi:hypothetical protein